MALGARYGKQFQAPALDMRKVCSIPRNSTSPSPDMTAREVSAPPRVPNVGPIDPGSLREQHPGEVRRRAIPLGTFNLLGSPSRAQ